MMCHVPMLPVNMARGRPGKSGTLYVAIPRQSKGLNPQHDPPTRLSELDNTWEGGGEGIQTACNFEGLPTVPCIQDLLCVGGGGGGG